MITIGLTGSIGMGKSTTAGFFSEAGIPVNDADKVVHDLYRFEAVEPVGEAFPGVVQDSVVNRRALSALLAADPDGFKRLEAIVHPLVRVKEHDFVEQQRRAGADMVVLDIPLLFESGRQKAVDIVVVVTCDPQIQRQRVLARPGMTEEKFKMILSRQIGDEQKRRQADFVVHTDQGLETARARVAEIVASLRAGMMSERSPDA